MRGSDHLSRPTGPYTPCTCGVPYAGRFGTKPGHSGNPGGRPAVAAEVRALAMTYTMEAVETLAAIMRDQKAPLTSRAVAANSLLDRPELSAKIETSQTPAEPDFSRLDHSERAVVLDLFAKITPFLEKIYGKPEGSLN
jgi:hypothetical protein